MFVGHYGIALVAKRLAPEMSAGHLFAATQLMDITHSALLLADVERVRLRPASSGPAGVELVSVPFSHSAPAALAQAAVAAAVACSAQRVRPGRRRRVAGTVGTVVASHYVLDVVANEGGIPLVTHDVELGLGLPVVAGVALESALLGGGLWIYLRSTSPATPAGRFAMPGLVAGLTAFNAYVAASSPPRSRIGLALSNLGAHVALAGLAHWADRYRRPPPRRVRTVVRERIPAAPGDGMC